MSLFGRSASGGAPADQEARKQEVMNQVRQELAGSHLQELVNKMTEKCYATCLPSGSELSSKDQSCLVNCQQRFLEGFDVVSRTYVARLGKERQAALAANPLSTPSDTLA